MSDEISVNDDGVKFKPEIMEKEKLYHCMFNDKIILAFKDHQDFLNCFEIEDLEIVNKIKSADGKDVSWIWDVDYEIILNRISSLTISGDRAYDLALRFHYSGFPATSMHVAPSIQELLEHLKSTIKTDGRAIVLPTYTSMLDLRAGLNKIGATHSFWEEK